MLIAQLAKSIGKMEKTCSFLTLDAVRFWYSFSRGCLKCGLPKAINQRNLRPPPTQRSTSGIHWWAVPKERIGKVPLHLLDSLVGVLGCFSEGLGPSEPQLTCCSPPSLAHSQEPPLGLGIGKEDGSSDVILSFMQKIWLSNNSVSLKHAPALFYKLARIKSRFLVSVYLTL